MIASGENEVGRGQVVAGLVGWLILTFAAAGVGSLFLPGEWYLQLAKPRWTPPNWVFGPVWSILYALMAVAAWLVWKRKGLSGAILPLVFFIVQLVLNAMWSWLFFGLKNPGLAFGEIIVLWLAILLTLIAFCRQTPLAGALLLPYFAWVSFAVILNLSIWQMNA
jgi:tryptophan-rich sensory protein